MLGAKPEADRAREQPPRCRDAAEHVAHHLHRPFAAAFEHRAEQMIVQCDLHALDQHGRQTQRRDLAADRFEARRVHRQIGSGIALLCVEAHGHQQGGRPPGGDGGQSLTDRSGERRVPGARSGFSSIFMDRHGERMIVPYYDPELRSAPAALPDLDDVALASVDVRWPDAALLALGAMHDRGLPTLVDLDTGPEDVLLKLFHNADMAIASADGARVLTGERDPLAAVRAMGRQHPGLVAVTTGEDGAFWRAPMDDRINHVRPRHIEAVDTLAAGDVFHGAFALRIAEGAAYSDAFEFAAAAAALKCTRFGGRLGAPTRAEVEALL